MSRRTLVAAGLVVGILGTCHAMAQAQEAREETAKLRVGVFDSRAVAVAYAASEGHHRKLKQLTDEHAKAKAGGDTETAKRLEAEGKAGQKRMHHQGFGAASVANILEEIKAQLPEIARKAGVDLIVSKWDLAYQAPAAKTIDVTQAVIAPFKPNARTLKIVHELENHRPVPAAQLENLKETD